MTLNKFYRLIFLLIISLVTDASAFSSTTNESAIFDSLIVSYKNAKIFTRKVDILNNISLELINAGKPSEAKDFALKGKTIAERIKYKKGLAVTLYNLASAHKKLDNYPKALEFYTKALLFNKELNNKQALADCYNELAIIYYENENYPTAIENHLNALHINQEVNNTMGICNSFNQLGLINYKQSNYAQALSYFNSSLDLALILNDQVTISSIYNNIGIVYDDIDNYEKALEFYTKSLKIDEAIENKEGIASSYNNLGVVYENQKKYKEAEKYYLKTLETEKEIEDNYGIAESFQSLGSLYLKQKKLNSALHWANNYLSQSKKIQSTALIIEAEQLLSNIYEKLNAPDKAFEHYKAYVKARDALFNKENTAKLIQAEMRFEFEKKEQVANLKLIETQSIVKDDIRKQKMISGSAASAGIFLLLLAIVSHKGNKQKKRANNLLKQKSKIIQVKNKSITDSINYAKRIQQAILPMPEHMQQYLNEFFIYYQPKDVVSGDFYSFAEKNGKIILAVADCTGHGIPGAFMSMIGHDQLTQIINEKGITKPSKVLARLNKGIKRTLTQTHNPFEKEMLHVSESNDGMDIALISMEFTSDHAVSLQYAGAYRPLYVISKGELIELAPDKTAIGGITEEDRTFKNNEITLHKGDSFYMFSDGFADQFGGESSIDRITGGKKFMSKRFKKLLLSIQDKNMNEQKEILTDTFKEWKGNLEQVDDVCVMGVRI